MSGSVEHLGGNRTVAGDGDDEERRQNFGQVYNSYVRVVNNYNKVELLKYDLGEDFRTETSIVVLKCIDTMVSGNLVQ